MIVSHLAGTPPTKARWYRREKIESNRLPALLRRWSDPWRRRRAADHGGWREAGGDVVADSAAEGAGGGGGVASGGRERLEFPGPEGGRAQQLVRPSLLEDPYAAAASAE